MTSDPSDTSGVSISGGDVRVRGDIVGHDKIVISDDRSHDVRGLANPFLGLQSFSYAERARYGGRAREVAAAVALLTAPAAPQPLTFITGASGSGKSSFAQAGLLPALEAHYAEFTVKHAVFRPSANPLAALGDALWRQLGLAPMDLAAATPQSINAFLSEHTPARQVNLVVADQFEELFTQSAAQPRDAFLDWLTHLAPFAQTRTHVIATLRADYLPELFAIPSLYEIAKRGLDLRAMSEADLADAIQQPLRAMCPDGSKRFEPQLVARLAHDAAEDAAYLPLLQVTLEELWRKGSLTLGEYTNLGDAIRARADKVLSYEDFDEPSPRQVRPPADQATMLESFLDLVDPSPDDARRDVRRRRSRDDLTKGNAQRARLIDTLITARLFSSAAAGAGTPVEVDIIHETLLTNWDRLRAAIDEKRHQLRQRARFEQLLGEWLGASRADDYLLSGVHLAEARELERRDDIALRSADAKAFLQRSIVQAEAEQQQKLLAAQRVAAAQQRAAGLLRWVAIVLLLGIVAAGGASLIAVQQRDAAVSQASARATAEANALTERDRASEQARARSTAEAVALGERDRASAQARISESRRLATQSFVKRDSAYDLAALLAVESTRLDLNLQSYGNLLDSLTAKAQLETFLHGHKDSVYALAYSPDGKLLASASCGKSRSVTACAQGEIILWDVATRERSGALLAAHSELVYRVAFSPDGKLLASGSCGKQDDRGVCEQGEIILWDVAARKPLGQPLAAHTDIVQSLSFSPDGKLLASGGCGHVTRDSTCDQGEVILWDVAVRIPVNPPLTAHADSVASVAFSPDGKLLASGGCGQMIPGTACEQGEIILWDVATHQRIRQPLAAHKREISSVAFSPDGSLLASGSDDNTVVLWDLRKAEPIAPPLVGHKDWVSAVAFSPDGKTLASSSSDRTIRLWDVTSPQRSGQLLSGHTDAVTGVVFSPDGKTLASSGADKTVIVWNLTARQRIGQPLTAHEGLVTSVAYSPDGKLLASGSADRSIILRDAATLQPLAPPLTGHKDTVNTLAFSPDNRTLASGSCAQKLTEFICMQGAIILWDVAARQLVTPPLAAHDDEVRSVAFSPDGKLLASGSDDATVLLWDVAARQPITRLLTGQIQPVWSVAFSPDGRVLAAGDLDGTINLWDVATRKPLAAPLVAEDMAVRSVAFSPDSKLLAAGGSNGTLVWDLTVRPPTSERLAGPESGVMSLAFSADGKTLVTGSRDGSINLWDVASRQPIAQPLRGRAPSVAAEGLGTDLLSIALSPGGKTIAAGSCAKAIGDGCAQGELILWDMDVQSWQARACRIANRNLTKEEWVQYINPDASTRRKTCDNLPLDLP